MDLRPPGGWIGVIVIDSKASIGHHLTPCTFGAILRYHKHSMYQWKNPSIIV